MNYTTKDNQVKRQTGRTILVCLFWLAFWQVLAMIVGNSLLLPTVPETLVALANLVKESSFYMDVAWTLFRCILAILLSVVMGVLSAMLAYKNGFARVLLTLPVSFFKAVPVMAIVIYVILLVKADWVAVVACLLMCFPIVYTNILAGLDSVSGELLEVAHIYELKNKDIVKLIYIPSVMPQFNSAMKIVAGLSWKAVVAAEVLSVPEFSLGQGMISAKYYLETPTLFAYIVVIVGLSLCLEKIIVVLTENLTSKKYQGSKLGEMKNDRLSYESLPGLPEVKLEGVCKSFEDKNVLEQFTKEIKAGSKLALFGPSGSGKTTLVRIIAGLEKVDEGRLSYSTKPSIAYLFQENRLLPWLNVYDNLALSMIRNDASLNDDLIRKMAESLEIDKELWSLPGELSGGMRHRVAIGRTLLADANLMILDEPFRGLDQDLKTCIVDRLWDKCTKNKTVIVITHNEKDLELLGIEETISLATK